jgi:hypothetical protein
MAASSYASRAVATAVAKRVQARDSSRKRFLPAAVSW